MRSSSRDHWIRRAIGLSWFTIIYNTIEGIVSIAFGLSDDSLALFGFGADSFIEVFSAFLVLWRFRGETGRSEALSISRERTATLGIGILFLVLAVGTGFGSIVQLLHRSHPATTVPGLVVSAVSLSFMFFLWKAKRNVGTELGSNTVLSDADCSLACIKLSIILFVGSLLYWVVPSLWWSDSIAALGLCWFISKEGFEMIQAARRQDFSGKSCCDHD